MGSGSLGRLPDRALPVVFHNLLGYDSRQKATDTPQVPMHWNEAK